MVYIEISLSIYIYRYTTDIHGIPRDRYIYHGYPWYIWRSLYIPWISMVYIEISIYTMDIHDIYIYRSIYIYHGYPWYIYRDLYIHHGYPWFI